MTIPNPVGGNDSWSLFDFIKVVGSEAGEYLGDLSFPDLANIIADSLLTFFFVFFIAKWVFDILISLGKGGMR